MRFKVLRRSFVRDHTLDEDIAMEYRDLLKGIVNGGAVRTRPLRTIHISITDRRIEEEIRLLENSIFPGACRTIQVLAVDRVLRRNGVGK